MPAQHSAVSIASRAPARFSRVAGLLCGLLLSLTTGFSASTLSTELSGTKRVLTRDTQGRTVESWAPFTKLLPGEEVAYMIACTNNGTEPAVDLVVNLPIPTEMIVILAEKSSSVEVTYSIDGGKAFDQLDRLAVTAPDGASRPARADDINFVRWKLTTALAAGATTKIGCRTLLK